MMENKIDEILADILNNNALTDDQKRLFKEWECTSVQNAKIARIIQELTFQKRILDKHQKRDTVFVQIKREIFRRKKRRRIFWSSCAAVSVLLVGFYFAFKWEKPAEKKFHMDQIYLSGLSVTKPAAELILPNGKKQLLSQNKSTVILSDDKKKIRTDKQTLIFESYTTEERVPEFYTINVPFGAEYNVILPDGTKTYLNAGSSLRYPDQFAEKKREVFLTGEGYFEVIADSLHPFIVHTANVSVRALGTSFNVKAYPDETWIKTTLEQGRVETRCGDHHVIMVPGTQVVYNKQTKETDYFPVNTRQFTSWKDGYYDFEDMSLEELMQIFSRWYNIKIEFSDSELKNIKFSGRLKRYDDLEPLFDRLEYTRDVKFVVEKDHITIQGK